MIESCDQAASMRVGSAPRPGVFLIAFEVSPAQRRLLEQRLEAQGARIEQRTEFTSYARDPEGNRIAISHFPERSQPEEA